MGEKVIILLFSFSVITHALDNGLAKLPAMGYNSWYDFGGALNEDNLKETLDKMVSLNLPQLGYQYFNLDDCWAESRDPHTNALIADPARFTSGTLKPLADYVHSKSMKFGTYTDRGTKTCAGKPGARGFEALDAKTYADWGVDYLKEDSCNDDSGAKNHSEPFLEYAKMRDALNATGRPIYFSLCGWNPWYAPVGSTLGNSWRIGPDDNDWNGILKNIDINADLARYAGPGGFNDPCLLLSQDWQGKWHCTEQQSRFQFSMWAMMASPLLISGNMRNMTAMNIETYSNEDVIAINQDILGKQGGRIVGGPLSPKTGTNVWAKPLANGDVALAFANPSEAAVDIQCDPDCLQTAFGVLPLAPKVCAIELWTKTRTMVEPSKGMVAGNVSANGGIQIYRISRTSSCSYA